jgi:Fe2+ or Zn2+ uptake regulation protein
MIETFKEIFTEKKISPSYTRTRIYAYLEKNKNHPTADKIYQALIGELPTLSKTTVYNVLKLFIEKGLVKPVNMSAVEVRYEIYKTPHSHFKCTKCGILYDIPHIETNYKSKILEGFTVMDEEVNLTGICPNCKAN